LFPTRFNSPVAGDVLLDNDPFLNNSPSVFKALLVHEFGHSLGLGHVESNSVMTPNVGASILQADDIDGITQIYGVQDNAPTSYTMPTQQINVNILEASFQLMVTGNGFGNRVDATSASETIFGVGGNDTLFGRGGNDSLYGGVGNDTMFGGTGDDFYHVNSATDIVTESASEGNDTVETTLGAYILGANVENLRVRENATFNFVGTGNALDNTISGGAGADQLNGGLGGDTLSGKTGNDFYYVDTVNDVIVENASEGHDTVFSTSNNFNLGANVEDLAFSGTGNFVGNGNALNNLIIGGAGIDALNGMGGADTMYGGANNDTYIIDNVGDIAGENLNNGRDTVLTTLNSFALDANLEDLAFTGTGNFVGTGNALNNLLVGGAGIDALNGMAGADTMYGQAGNDTYIIDNAGDVAGESLNNGRDTVLTTLNNYTLHANVEDLAYTGTGNFVGNGNALNNLMFGNAGSDTLDGKAGADDMIGKGGDDFYFVDNVSDTVSEAANEGTDRVNSLLSVYLLDANVENLAYYGAANLRFTGIGNALDNVIFGNAGNDVFDGGAGSDTYFGYGGSDTAAYAGAQSAYTILNLGTHYTVQHNATGDIDTLYDMDVLQFTDGSLLI
jgi:Ca2+-binding RTX toxin-like protein